ncbi:SNF1-related protein kinase regulatory subunit beta-2, partial [Tetrabaena socialis]
SHGGSHVEVEGSFDNWTTRQPLQKSGKDFTIIKLLPPGVYQYKFIVDGEWKYDPNQPAMFDEMRNVNNVIEVHEYVPENLEGVSGFDPPPSPPSSYNCPNPVADDYAKEPSIMPPHLQLTLLNVPPASGDAQAVLPRPQHVILNHVYCQRGQSVQALVIGATTRYKSKYITTVMYKPKARRRVLDAAAT